MRSDWYSTAIKRSRSLRGKLALFVIVFGCLPAAYGFGITEVRFTPRGTVSQFDEVELTIDITTGHSPAFLYRETEVSIDSDEVIVSVYPDDGQLTAVGSVTERVNVGRLGVGSYRLLVLLRPAKDSNGSPKFIVRDFIVVPVLMTGINAERMFFLTWDDPHEEYALEWASEPLHGNWQAFGQVPTGWPTRWLWITDLQQQQFFRLRRKE